MPIMAATNATNTSPRRNIVTVIRTVSPRSGAYLVRAIWHLRSLQAALSLYEALPGPMGNLPEEHSRKAEASRRDSQKGSRRYALGECAVTDGRSSRRGACRRRGAYALHRRWRPRTAGCSPRSRTCHQAPSWPTPAPGPPPRRERRGRRCRRASRPRRPARRRARSAWPPRRRRPGTAPRRESGRSRPVTRLRLLSRVRGLRTARVPVGAGLELRRRTRRELAFHLRQLGLDRVVRAELVEFRLDGVLRAAHVVLERARGEQLVDRACPGLHLRRLVLGTLDRQADVAHFLRDAGEGLVDAGLRLGRGVGRLDGFLPGAEGVHPGLQPLRGEGQLLFLLLQVRVLPLQVVELTLQAGLVLQGGPRQVLAALRQRVARLVVAAVDLFLQRVHLQLDTLAGGGDVSDPAPDPRQHLDLLLVGIVQGLARVFHPVQRPVGLGPENQRDSLHHAHRRGRPLHSAERRPGRHGATTRRLIAAG